ncbi:uncharacterized protein KGF55_003102 [Candida pseudojiufengensis]|uniref:uncharacterized protein n=1 Tax=Candida pseudojiufengensis TaxID=497109 RepID=UPI00222418FA|nr:uncharacterized protein KGF55_003102 [Candida pseudojiufengensis]KAI5963310.1 hypothetical protein KGF55_003102 [Candida pseudojiufengensis]
MLPSLVRTGGYVWKFTPHITSTQRANLKKRMLQVDENIEQIYQGLKKSSNIETQDEHKNKKNLKTGFDKIDYLKFEFPKFNQMSSRDKYTTFSRHSRDYRKPIHRVPKWTKLSFREDPKHF